MSRFADRTAVKRYVLGPCQCDGTPHDEDWIDLRSELSGAELIDLQGQTTLVARLQAVIVAWNLRDGTEEAPIDAEHLERLSLPTLDQIGNWWSDLVSGFALPNGSGAPSQNGSRAGASRIQTTPKRR